MTEKKPRPVTHVLPYWLFWLVPILNFVHNLTHEHIQLVHPDGQFVIQMCKLRGPWGTVSYMVRPNEDAPWMATTREWVWQMLGMPEGVE